MWDMSPLNPEDPCYDVFQCDPSLDYDTHIEANIYTSTIQPERLELCCHCAGVFDSPVMMHPSLKAPAGPYSVVLPVCKDCLDGGCQIIARNARQNAESKKNKLDAEAARKAARQEKAAEAAAKEEEAQRQKKQLMPGHPPALVLDLLQQHSPRGVASVQPGLCTLYFTCSACTALLVIIEWDIHCAIIYSVCMFTGRIMMTATSQVPEKPEPASEAAGADAGGSSK